jgi:IS30 family transposase
MPNRHSPAEIDLLKQRAGAVNGQRIGTDRNREISLFAQECIQAPQERPASGEDDALVRDIRRQHLGRSLTWDHGKEMGEHVRFTLDTGCRSTSVICAARGNARRENSTTGSWANTSPKLRTCPGTIKHASTRSPAS